MTATDYQIDYNGTVMGDGTPWDIVDESWQGLKEFTTRGSDVPIPNSWGSIPGSTYVNSRYVVVTFESVNQVDILVLEAALTPPPNASPDTLAPVRWKTPLREEMLCYGRVARRMITNNLKAALGTTQLTVEFEFPDPRVYSAVLQNASLTVFVAGGGALEYSVSSGTNAAFEYSLASGADAAFDYVGSSTSGLQILTNNGYVTTYPLIVVNPASGIGGFVLTNQTTGQVFTMNQPVSAGATLIADMQAAQTALSSTGAIGTTPITVNGANVYANWQPPRIPLALVPGPNILRFDVLSGDIAATAAVTAPSGYL